MTPTRRALWRQRLESVEIEFRVARTAARQLAIQLQSNPSFGREDEWRVSDARRWIEQLEATYLIRLFASFEQALRDYWSQGLGRKSHPKTEDLIDSIASRCGVSMSTRNTVHAIRGCRNRMIHEEAVKELPATLPDASQQLSSFLSRLPFSW